MMCQEEKKYWYVITKWLFNSTFLKKNTEAVTGGVL